MVEYSTYKSIGEICDIVCGQDYKSVQDVNGAYPIYGTGGIMGYASEYRCPANSVIIGRKGSINNPIFVEEPFWNVDTAFGVVPKSVVPKYFFYFCRNYDFTKHDVSVTIPSLRRTDILKIQVPIRSLAEQKRIVAELDLLTGIIDKQKQQLKELDNLALSVFYDMFGDPIENNKGWNQNKIKDIAVVRTGPFGSLLHKDDYVGGGIPLVNPIHMRGYEIVPDMEFSITDSKAKELSNYLLRENDVVFARRGDIGRCAIVSNEQSGFICGTGSLFVRFDNMINPTYILYMIRSESFTRSLLSKAKGATMLNINSSTIEDISVPIPPTHLQNDFASYIQDIRRQKESINRSIAESQKLFDYTMDKYFG